MDLERLPTLWALCKAGDKSARDELVESYMWLARKLAHAQQVPEHVEREELTSWAAAGLLDAVNKFDPETSDGQLHRHFMSYASMRIRGAILDGMKHPSVSWASRTVWRKLKAQRAAEEDLFQKLGRYPSREELAAHLGVQPRELETLQQVIPIGATGSQDPDEDGPDFSSEGGEGFTDQEGAEAAMAARLAEAIASLPRESQDVLGRLYYDGVTLIQAARDTGRQTSKVRSARIEALRQLRIALQTP